MKANIFRTIAGTLNFPFGLLARHDQGEIYLSWWKLPVSVILSFGIFGGSNLFFGEAEGAKSLALFKIVLVFTVVIFIYERMKIRAKEARGEHTMCKFSGFPRFLPQDPISWFVYPVIAILWGTYDLAFLSFFRGFSLYFLILGVFAVIEHFIFLHTARVAQLERRDAKLAGALIGDNEKEFSEAGETKAPNQNKTDELISIFS